MNFTCVLLEIILLQAAGAVIHVDNHTKWEESLKALEEIVRGPASGRSLVIHLDPFLPLDARQALFTLQSVQGAARVVTALPSEQLCQRENDLQTLSRHSSALFIEVYLSHPPRLCLHWNPRNVLFYSLTPDESFDVLRDLKPDQVEGLAFVTTLPGGSLGVYTWRPFARDPTVFLGHWAPQNFTSWDTLFVNRYPSFEGHRFRLAAWHYYPPFLYTNKATSTEEVTGSAVNMVDALSEKLNFTYTIYKGSPDGKWGVLQNKTWIGLLGQVHRNERDFTINGFFPSPERLRDFDASVVYRQDGYALFVPITPTVPEWMKVQRPFSSMVWGFLALSSLASLFFLHLQVLVLGQRWRESAKSANTTWFSMQGLALGQSVSRLYTGMGMRVFLSLWLLCCLVLATAYTCNLVAILSRPPDLKRIHTLLQLAESDHRLATVDYGGFLQESLDNSEDKTVKQLKQKLDLFPDEETTVASMLDDSHVFLGIKIETQYMLQEKFKMYHWYLLPERLFTNYLCWIFRKNVPWKRKFDSSIQRIFEAGLYNQWLKVEMDKVSDGQRRQGGSSTWYVDPLNLPNLQGVFYVLFIGLFISGAIFSFEYMWSERSFPSC